MFLELERIDVLQYQVSVAKLRLKFASNATIFIGDNFGRAWVLGGNVQGLRSWK